MLGPCEDDCRMYRWPTVGWAAMALFAALVDYLLVKHRQPTLSTTIRNAGRHPIRRWVVISLWGSLTAHLFLHMRYDPLVLLGRRLKW